MIGRNDVFWFTGLPCSGKTTIVKEMAKKVDGEILDGDDIRDFMKNSDFSDEGRRKHMLAVAEWAYRFSKYTTVFVSLVSPIRAVRDEIKRKYPNFKEIHVDCSLQECESRDVKGMYAKARAGEIKGFTGVGSKYEEPFAPDFYINTEKFNLQQCISWFETAFFGETREKYCLFIGRYQPLHAGHVTLMKTQLDAGKNIAIGLRNTGIKDTDPYSVDERIKMIKKEFGENNRHVKVIRLPDIEAVCYGRGVGYDIRQIKLDDKTEEISATKIRKNMKGDE